MREIQNNIWGDYRPRLIKGLRLQRLLRREDPVLRTLTAMGEGGQEV